MVMFFASVRNTLLSHLHTGRSALVNIVAPAKVTLLESELSASASRRHSFGFSITTTSDEPIECTLMSLSCGCLDVLADGREIRIGRSFCVYPTRATVLSVSTNLAVQGTMYPTAEILASQAGSTQAPVRYQLKASAETIPDFRTEPSAVVLLAGSEWTESGGSRLEIHMASRDASTVPFASMTDALDRIVDLRRTDRLIETHADDATLFLLTYRYTLTPKRSLKGEDWPRYDLAIHFLRPPTPGSPTSNGKPPLTVPVIIEDNSSLRSIEAFSFGEQFPDSSSVRRFVVTTPDNTALTADKVTSSTTCEDGSLDVRVDVNGSGRFALITATSTPRITAGEFAA